MRPMTVHIARQLRDMSGPMRLEVKLDLATGERLALFGQSGAGKTSLLRLIAGLDRPDQGSIYVGEIPWTDGKQFLPVKDRGLGMVFQDQALFPNLRLRKQIAFGQNGPARDTAYVTYLIQQLGLTGLENASMATLSGGQRQRVALGRALAGKPKLLLLDEPFQGLDRESLECVLSLLDNLHAEHKFSLILISHQTEVIKRISDRVLRLDRGKVTEIGTPEELFPGSVAKVLTATEKGTHWEVQFERKGEVQTTELPKSLFPKLRAGDQIRLSGGHSL